MRRPRAGLRHLWREGVLPNVPLLVEALETLIRRDPPNAVVHHPASIGAPWVCQRYEIPHALGTLAPQAWTMYNVGNVHREAGPDETSGQRLWRGFLRLTRPLFRAVVDRDLNRIRRQYGYPPARDVFLRQFLDSDLNLGLWSPVLRGPLPHDPPHSRICGFPWFDRGHHVQQPERDIARFLEEGQPPVVFTMGTTVITAAGRFYQQAAEACRRLGRRGLLLAGSARNAPTSLPPGVRAFEYAPLSTVLPRACATVHHGGIGTTGQALRAGKPSLIVPVAWDQFENAAWARRLNVSATLERGRVSPTTLAAALDRLLSRTAVLARAAHIGGRIEQEDGAATAVEHLETLVAARRGLSRSVSETL
jgi:UDP:flavonoid glycosyltransferase YjiC (YdhE family)